MFGYNKSSWRTTESVHREGLTTGDPVKKVTYILIGSLLALCLLVVVGYQLGTAKSQTNTQQPASSATSAPDTTATTVKNRPVARWATSNMSWLSTLINDSKTMLSYLKDMNLAYAEIACPQLRCDIATMRGGTAPWGISTRALVAAPSGHKCPPIPDAQTAADLNVGLAQLESAINHIIRGIRNHNGDLIMLGESETQAACDTFDKVSQDLANVPSQESTLQPLASTPMESIQSFFDAVQAGDRDVVSTLTGGSGGAPGIEMWCSKGLNAFVGHTTFKPWRYVITHNDNTNANLSFDGFMTFNDPAGFPAVSCPLHFYIDGDFKFKAVDGKWIIVSLPNYQEALNDGPTKWGSSPYIYPYPGDAI